MWAFLICNNQIIPKKFTDNMRGKLPEKVTLKGPNEVNWDVNLVKGKDDAVLEGDEWKDFTKAYSLKKGDILMFKYNRNECFEVLIFDRSSLCEKESSYFVRKCQKPRHDDDSAGRAVDNSAEELTVRCQEGDINSDCTPRNRSKRNMDRTPKNYSSDRANHTRGIDVIQTDIFCYNRRTLTLFVFNLFCNSFKKRVLVGLLEMTFC